MLDCKARKRKELPGGVESLDDFMDNFPRFKVAKIDCSEGVVTEGTTNLDGMDGGNFGINILRSAGTNRHPNRTQ